MTLDEAIIHAEQVADSCAVTDGNLKCEREHRQLVKWLKELKRLRASGSEDLIRRQDAIDALGEEPPVWYDGDDEIAERNQWRRDKAEIESLPSADPVNMTWDRQGLWVRFRAIEKAASKILTIDAVEVVRCKDCIHWFPHTQCGFDEDNDEYHDYCGLLIPDDDYYAFCRKSDDYCSRGKRREDGE